MPLFEAFNISVLTCILWHHFISTCNALDKQPFVINGNIKNEKFIACYDRTYFLRYDKEVHTVTCKNINKVTRFQMGSERTKL